MISLSLVLIRYTLLVYFKCGGLTITYDDITPAKSLLRNIYKSYHTIHYYSIPYDRIHVDILSCNIHLHCSDRLLSLQPNIQNVFSQPLFYD